MMAAIRSRKQNEMKPQPYVPLWKQWQQSKEYKDYRQNELPTVKERMALMGQTLSEKEREELMAKQFQVRWMSSSGKIEESTLKSEKAAKDKARDLSFENSPVQVGEVEDGKLLQQWNYEKGRQQVMDTKKQVTVAPITKKEANSIKSNTEKGNNDMATQTAKKTPKTTPKKAARKAANPRGQAKVAAKAKTASSVAASGPSSPKKPGSGGVRDQFELRAGSNKEKLVDALLAAKGKALGMSALLKATYGNSKEENKGALMMVMKGVTGSIENNKIKLTLVKAKEGKETTFALKAK